MQCTGPVANSLELLETRVQYDVEVGVLIVILPYRPFDVLEKVDPETTSDDFDYC